ncbi:hypothetical protein CR956_00800 [Candidatus Saccharibacteria bacterium]|nr:MAG: hypothetical protein CR956_00800 [Candidatus Saccharibacteria bacterium]
MAKQDVIDNKSGQWAVDMAKNSGDNIMIAIMYVGFVIVSGLYFVISFVAVLFDELKHDVSLSSSMTAGDSIIMFFLQLILASIFYFVWFLVLVAMGMLMIRIYRHRILGNSLLVKYSDYAWLREWTNNVAKDLNMPEVEIYITQDPYINAYAFGFAKPYCIVLNSGTIRYLTDDELKFVVVHEMGHIKYKHTNINLYLIPFLQAPIIRVFASWIVGFWSRRTELTADRLALYYLRDPKSAKKSLIKVHVGPDASKYLNDVAEQWLDYTTKGLMNAFSQTFSDHPFLVRRLKAVDVIYPDQKPQAK